MTGRFITIEGVEGAGKSSVIDSVSAQLEKNGISVWRTREPGGTHPGEAVRDILLNPDFSGMEARCELLLMFAARAEHIATLIRPALEKGDWVVCDRFTDATYAYQGGGREMDEGPIEWLEQFVQDDLRPDLTVFLDVPVNVGLERANSRSKPDRFESEKAIFFERVRNRYLEQARREPQRVKVVDSSRSLEQVIVSVAEIVKEFVEKTRG